jgi:hypothetical protein
MHWEPVCGADGKTYGNGCSAKCKGIKVVHRGECKPGDALKTDTMASETAASSKSGHRCSCAKVYAPVCCKGNKQYGNACEAKCAGAEIESTGECPAQQAAGSLTSTTHVPAQHSETAASSKAARCSCAKVYAPVCCKGNKQYGNACEAKCAGAEIESTGECPVQHALTSTTNAPTQHAESAPCKCDPAVKEVCGDDHKTYNNQCMAECAGVKVAGEGACKAAAPSKPSKSFACSRSAGSSVQCLQQSSADGAAV